jgi:lipopolysaccharide export system ATP-binding protein
VRKTRGDALRAANAAALKSLAVWRPNQQYILLDEPFAGIDPIAIDDIREIILYLRNQGIGILITDTTCAKLSITDRAYIMAEGEILRRGKPRDLIRRCRCAAALLGERLACNFGN